MSQEKQLSPGLDLGTLLGGMLGSGGDASGDALSEGIGRVLSDPQMMAKLPDMIEMLRPLMGGATSGGDPAGAVAVGSEAVGRENAEGRESEREEKSGGEPPPAVPASAGHRGGGAHDRRIALLCALRPYLSPRRQEAIDYILRMDKMGKLFRNG